MNKFFLVHRKTSQEPFDCNPTKCHINLNEAMLEAERLCIKEKAGFEILGVSKIGCYYPEISVTTKYIDSIDESEEIRSI